MVVFKDNHEQLLEIDGVVEFFLMTASMNVNWGGSSTDIPGDKLIAVAAAVNRQFGTHLDCMDIKLGWAKLRALWETWSRRPIVCLTKRLILLLEKSILMASAGIN